MTDTLYKKLSNDRKELQEKDLIPQWYSTGALQMFQEKYEYDTNGKSVRGQFERIAKTAASYIKDKYPQAEEKFFNLLWQGWLSPSTPVLANTGTNRGMSVSCSGSTIEDSIDGFYGTLHETAMLTKNGFGTSAYLGDIRPRGTKIAAGGKASGVLPVVKAYIQTMRDVAQGTQRRGAWAGYIEIDHGDFDELADHCMHEPDDMNIGWIIKQSFIDKCNQSDTEALRRFRKALKLKMVHGRGYFCFIDKINANKPESYVNNDLSVKASNLCVAPETLVLTDKGQVQIHLLENQEVNVWNGEQFSSVTVKKTGENQKLIRIKTNTGQEVDCTPEHKFYVLIGYNKGYKVVPAKDLKVNDKLIKFDLPIIEGNKELKYAYDNGFYSADGCLLKSGQQRIYLYHEKMLLKPYLTSVVDWSEQPAQIRSYGHTRDLKDKFFVPDSEYTVDTRLTWLAGLCDGDGTISRAGENESIQIGSIEKEFLVEVQLMLQTLGITSKVTQNRTADYRLLPANDGTGELKLFYCQTAYRLLISSTGLYKLISLGFSPKRLKVTHRLSQREAEKFIQIEDIVDNGRFADTYCFTEPLRHMGMFNGILTGNCDEITLHADKDHTYTCVLSSMNVAKFEEWKNTDAVYWATIFLDCIAEDFIQKGKNVPQLDKAVRATEKGRAIGLGQCGWHTLLQTKRIPFESFEAHMLSQDIAKHIFEESLRASQELAIALGEPEWCKGLGIRHTHRIAIAPTKSTALLMGGISEGISPDPGMVYSQETAAGTVDRVTPVFLALMKEKGVYTKATIQDITDHVGSVQHVKWLTEEEKAVFKTAFEINQKSILRLAGARKRYIDQWQSLNLFFAAGEEEEWIAEVHAEAFNDPNILGLYYIYTQAGVQASKGECEVCM